MRHRSDAAPTRWFLVLAALAVLAGMACNRTPPEREKVGATAREVRLISVEERGLDKTIEITGTLAADEQAAVAVKVAGKIASVAIDLSSKVEKGDPIAQIDPTDYKLRVEQVAAAVSQARVQLGLPPEGTDDTVDVEATAIVRQAAATLEEAKTARARAESLARDGLATGAERDAAEATFLRAETAVQSAREEVRLRLAALRQRRSELRLVQQALADTLVRAPIAGVVLTRRVNTGEYVAAGAPVADIVRINPLRLKLVIPEREASSVVAGQVVYVTVDGDPKRYDGLVARLAPSLDQQNRTLLVEADIQNPGSLRPGMMARAQIVVGSKPAPVVPSSAIVTFAGVEKVIVVDAGKAVEKKVTTGKRVGDRTEILSGVKVGERVVLAPGSLQQGQAVRIAEGK
jgi:RND family efflux transporter MFP subunit